MATTYNWVVSAMEEKPTEGNLSDVVVTVHWRRNASLTSGETTYTADTYGSYACPTPTGSFTAFADLTFEQVTGWLDAGLDVEALNAGLDAQIEAQINPPVIQLPLPWAASGSI